MVKTLTKLNIALGNCIDSLLKDLKYQRRKEISRDKEIIRILEEIEKVDNLKILTDKEKMETVIQICTYYKDYFTDKIIELESSEKQF